MVAQWAKLVGDGARAEGFEEWMTQSLASHFTEGQLADIPEDQRLRYESRLRIAKTLVAAAIETARSEDAFGGDSVTIICDVADIMGFAMAGLISLTFEKSGHTQAAEHLVSLLSQSLDSTLATSGQRLR